jgi:AcrR family transcriptional regulator
MKDISDRIIDVAIELAEEGGFDNVRQRDVARRAGIALGTLYKRFRSKEDILAAAIARQTELLEALLAQSPVRGDSPAARAGALFEMLTRAMAARPHYARAVLRAMASGPEVAGKVTAYHERMNRLTVAALRGRELDGDATAQERSLALALQQIWFASLVGWSAGLFDVDGVCAQVRGTAELLIRGAAYRA